MVQRWQLSVFLGLGSSLLVPVCAQATMLADTPAVINDAFMKSLELSQDLDALDRADPVDTRVIVNHYSEIRRAYLANPLYQFANTSRPVLANFVQEVSKAGNDAETLFGTSYSAKSALSSCLERNKFDKLDGALTDYTSSLNSAVQGLSRNMSDPTDAFASSSSNGWGDTSRDQMTRSVAIFNQDWAENAKKCCTQAIGAFVEKLDTAQQNSESARLSLGCDSYKKQIAKVQDEIKSKVIPPSVKNVPNPLRSTRLSTKDMAYVLKNKSSSLRAANSQMDSDAAEAILADAEQDCRKAVLRKQQASHPILGTKAEWAQTIGNLVGTAWCTGVQGAAAQWWSLNTQQLVSSLGLASGCDPSEIAYYNSLRNPYQIDQKYGLSQMLTPFNAVANSIPPLVANYTPYSPMGLGTLTPFGASAASVPVVGATPVKVTGSTATSRGSVAATTTKTLVGGVSTSLTNRRLSSSRGLITGATYARATRSLASDISRGKAPLQNATTLKSVASTGRKLVTTMVANNAKLGDGTQRRRALASQAATIRTSARNLASVRTTRTTAQNTANSLNNRQRATSTGNVTNIQQAAEQGRKMVEVRLQQIESNVQMIITKSESARQQILQLTQQAQTTVSQAYRDLINLAPKKQLERMGQLRTALSDLHKQIAPLKVAYYGYQSALLEQTTARTTVVAFGVQGTSSSNFQGVTPTNDGSSRGSVTPVTPRSTQMKLPVPEGFPVRTFWQGEARWASFFDWAIRPAFAADGAKKLWSNDQEWVVEWDKFLKDYDAYVETKVQEEKKAEAEVVSLLKQRMKTPIDQATDLDTDSLGMIQIYSKSILEESEDLINAASTKGADSITLDGNVIALLKQSREEARGIQEGLDELTVQYKESLPVSDEDSPEAWWAVLPDLVSY